MQWQLIGDDQWIYGLKVRGIVRYRVAEVYFDEDSPDPAGGWKWNHKYQYGYERNLRHAIEAAERAMGIDPTLPVQDAATDAARWLADNPTPLHGEQ